MNKLSNLIFVRREGLEQKWWHRLAKVLIWGTTVVVLIIGIVTIVSSSHYKNNPNFDTTKFIATAQQQGVDYADLEIWLLENGQYGRAVLPVQQNSNINNGGPLTSEQLKQMDSDLSKPEPQSTIDQDLITRNNLDRIAFNQTENYLIKKGLILIILLPIAWFIFWESIIYRAVVYIVYGKRK